MAVCWLYSIWLAGSICAGAASDYAVVVSRTTHANQDWRQVVDVLREKHNAAVIVYEASVDESLPKLREQFPRYACFVAQPSEASREFAAKIHRLTRQLDDDPYTDCFWGILTGYDAANALRIAKQKEPLTIHKVAGGTEVALDMCEEGMWWCELNKGKMVKKAKGGEPARAEGPADSTEALVKSLNDYQPDLFVTSGHATEHDWMIGFRYKNGFFKHENGRLYGLDTQGRKLPVDSPNPKVYLPIGNCLMGHIDRTDCMALSWMNSAGVCQMIGYTVPSWYGYAGWGCLDYFVEQPGRYTFTEGFFANQAALIHRLATFFPGQVAIEIDAFGKTQSPLQLSPAATEAGLAIDDARGLLYDRDFVAFYGDPAWQARMAMGATAWRQTLTEKNGVWTFEIKPNRGEKSFAPINNNGSQRGGRPFIEFLPKRIKDVKILEGGELKPVIADNFILVPNPRQCDPAKTYRILFQAKLAN
jgi:zinc protease